MISIPVDSLSHFTFFQLFYVWHWMKYDRSSHWNSDLRIGLSWKSLCVTKTPLAHNSPWKKKPKRDTWCCREETEKINPPQKCKQSLLSIFNPPTNTTQNQQIQIKNQIPNTGLRKSTSEITHGLTMRKSHFSPLLSIRSP